MGKLKWAEKLIKKGGSKVTDIQKGTKPKGKKTTKWELEAEENKLENKKIAKKRKQAKKALDDSIRKSHERRHKFKEDQVRMIEKEEKAFKDRQYLKDK